MATGIVPPFAGWPCSGSTTIAALGQIMPAFADAYLIPEFIVNPVRPLQEAA
jgi:hypothetical protein